MAPPTWTQSRHYSPPPATLWRIGFIHCVCVILCCVSLVSVTNQKSTDDLCTHSPDSIRTVCKCEQITPSESSDLTSGLRLVCKNLNQTDVFRLEEALVKNIDPNSIIPLDADMDRRQNALNEFVDAVVDIIIHDSRLKCVNIVAEFFKFSNLKQLSIKRSQLTQIVECVDSKKSVTPKSIREMPLLTHLDLSENALTTFPKTMTSQLPHLKHLNLSGNALRNLEADLFPSNLKVLDLSSNQLNQDLKKEAFYSLPSGLTYIDISSNAWICSHKLSWIYNWSLPLTTSGVLARANATRCKYDENSSHEARLLLVMEYYVLHVLPHCPFKDNCQCKVEYIQETVILTSERTYTVSVSCPRSGLTYFPKLPKHTRIVDLSGNKLDSGAFELLKVNEHNYNEVDNLKLNHNLITKLPENILDMRLTVSFSARGNLLTSISYDLAHHLIRRTSVVELSDNPWICACNSQINDRNLIAKLSDSQNMTCGPESDVELVGKKLDQLDSDQLCPPDTNGESQELLLQLTCGLLSILIVIVLTKLSYDAWVYRTRGQLPWLVLKMP